MSAPLPEGLKPCRIITFVLTVQTANQPVKGQAAGAPDAWAVGMNFSAIRAGNVGNTSYVAFGAGGFPDLVLVPGATGAVDAPAGYTFYLGDLTVSGPTAGDQITGLATVPE